MRTVPGVNNARREQPTAAMRVRCAEVWEPGRSEVEPMRLGIDDYGLRHQRWDALTLTERCIELGAANLMFSVDGLR